MCLWHFSKISNIKTRRRLIWEEHIRNTVCIYTDGHTQQCQNVKLLKQIPICVVDFRLFHAIHCNILLLESQTGRQPNTKQISKKTICFWDPFFDILQKKKSKKNLTLIPERLNHQIHAISMGSSIRFPCPVIIFFYLWIIPNHSIFAWTVFFLFRWDLFFYCLLYQYLGWESDITIDGLWLSNFLLIHNEIFKTFILCEVRITMGNEKWLMECIF
jgi:hypothetical protein